LENITMGEAMLAMTPKGIASDPAVGLVIAIPVPTDESQILQAVPRGRTSSNSPPQGDFAFLKNLKNMKNILRKGCFACIID
jgi:hypothetical protein